MGTRPWSEEQVAAAAPDQSSLAAARKLGRKLAETVAHDTALAGVCAGSGRTPYRVVVDLAGPAFRCSCPSRKFPCKHALALLLAWSSGEVPEGGELPTFATEWLAARAARATAAPAKPADPEGTEQRRARVAGGLAELEVWLADQVRTGLARADRVRGFEAIAARMVDAQAPAVASALRRLPAVAAGRSDWPRLVLREYARLHLLATAHRGLAELPGPLAAGVRAHLGYPISAEVVRAGPAVRDEWMVLGVRASEEERLHTRRTWLRGRSSGRWAMLVEHSFGRPVVVSAAPRLGFMADASLHYYPGAANPRVQWGTRHGADTPVTSLPLADGAGRIAAALRDHAAALAGDPWLRAQPVLLTEVVPVPGPAGWWLAEPDGTALPIAPGEQPWRLLAVSGGHPVTVVGDLTAEGLVPVAVFAAGELHRADEPLGPALPQPEPPQPGPETADLVSVALLGTAQRGLDSARLPAPVAGAVARIADPAAALLAAAALQDLLDRGGVRAGTAAPPAPAADDDRPLLPRAAAERLPKLLGSRSPFLPEWFAAAAPGDFRAPDALGVRLLEFARTLPEYRGPLLRLAGPRGRWLAAAHPSWNDFRTSTAEVAEVWAHGKPAARRNLLRELRRDEPVRARELLAGSWATESGAQAAELLAVLGDGLGPADEELLETALAGRRGDVRRTAAALLARLPGSAFTERMRQRAALWLPVRGGQLELALPAELPPDAKRDGLAESGAEFGYRWSGGQDDTAALLRRLVSATPLAHWEQAFGSPGRAVATVLDDRFRRPLFDGWMDAALAAGDGAWAAALFDAGVPTDQALLRRRELFALLPAPERITRLLRLDGAWLSELEALLPAVEHPWPEQVAHHVLLLLHERARTAARRPGASGAMPTAHRSLLAAAAAHLPPDAAPVVAATAHRCDDAAWGDAFQRLARDLTIRSTMLEELQ
ncbi:SWIM zinc finger family protein [Nocardia sp. NPDC057353]|uniref:SWIM zinc finger family protein n=1 Tax=Nocardia sp. NPDC057353 TaxID=3346104 RepID=UPI00363D289D